MKFIVGEFYRKSDDVFAKKCVSKTDDRICFVTADKTVYIYELEIINNIECALKDNVTILSANDVHIIKDEDYLKIVYTKYSNSGKTITSWSVMFINYIGARTKLIDKHDTGKTTNDIKLKGKTIKEVFNYQTNEEKNILIHEFDNRFADEQKLVFDKLEQERKKKELEDRINSYELLGVRYDNFIENICDGEEISNDNERILHLVQILAQITDDISIEYVHYSDGYCYEAQCGIYETISTNVEIVNSTSSEFTHYLIKDMKILYAIRLSNIHLFESKVVRL